MTDRGRPIDRRRPWRHPRPRSPERRPLRPSSPSGDEGELPLEVGIRQVADLDRAEDAVAVDEVALRTGEDPIGPLDRAVRVDDGLPRPAVLRRELTGRVDGVVSQDAEDHEPRWAMCGGLLGEERHLLPARNARRAPEVDDDRMPAE